MLLESAHSASKETERQQQLFCYLQKKYSSSNLIRFKMSQSGTLVLCSKSIQNKSGAKSIGNDVSKIATKTVGTEMTPFLNAN